MHPELQSALDLARSLPAEELPGLIGQLAEITATASARLAAPATARPDELLDIGEAARRMGISRQYLYRAHRRFPFTRRAGRKLLFSAAGLDAYLSRSR